MRKKRSLGRMWWHKVLALSLLLFLLVPQVVMAQTEDGDIEGGDVEGGDIDEKPIQVGDLVCEKWPQGIVVKDYTGDGGKVVIPEMVDGQNVYAIVSEAFQFESTVTSIVMPDTIQAIGHSAFKGCSRLEEIVWPRSLWGIGVRAFSGCSALKEVVLPDDVGYISEEAFADCTALELVTLPERLYDIAGSAFRDCTNLRVLEILGDPTSGAVVAQDIPFGGCENLEQIFYGGNEDDLLDLVSAEQLTWADTFLITFNVIADDVVLDTFLGDGGDIAVPQAVGGHRVRAFGPDAFAATEDVGRILFAGSDTQWEAIDKSNGNEDALKDVLCLASFVQMPVLELEWEKNRITGASFASLEGKPLQGRDILQAWPDVPGSYRFEDLAGTKLRSFDILTTGAQVTRSNQYDSESALVVLAGDVTGSGVLNITQLVRMAAILTGTEEELEDIFVEAADLNGTGKVEITDLVMESQWLADYA